MIVESVIMGKTILYVGNILFPDGDAASHRVIGNAKALKELGYQVLLLGCREDEKRELLHTREIVMGFDCYYFSKPNTKKEWYKYLVSINWYASILESVDIVIAYNYPAIALNKLRKYCNRTGKKVYADCTEWFDPSGGTIGSMLKKADTSIRMRKVQPKLDGIIVISSFLQRFYEQRNIPVICVPPLIDKSDKKWCKEGCMGINCDIQLAYVGNPGSGGKDKLDVIISAIDEAVNRCPALKIHFTIVGITRNQYLDRFSSLSKNMDKIVSFKGRMSNIEALDIIKKSNYSIFLRDKNLVTTAGFPTKFSESIACGTPVLTNDTSDISRYLVNGKNGFLLDTTSANSLCESLYIALSIDENRKINMKNYCLNDNTFDYHSFIMEFSKLFPSRL